MCVIYIVVVCLFGSFFLLFPFSGRWRVFTTVRSLVWWATGCQGSRQRFQGFPNSCPPPQSSSSLPGIEWTALPQSPLCQKSLALVFWKVLPWGLRCCLPWEQNTRLGNVIWSCLNKIHPASNFVRLCEFPVCFKLLSFERWFCFPQMGRITGSGRTGKNSNFKLAMPVHSLSFTSKVGSTLSVKSQISKNCKNRRLQHN